MTTGKSREGVEDDGEEETGKMERWRKGRELCFVCCLLLMRHIWEVSETMSHPRTGLSPLSGPSRLSVQDDYVGSCHLATDFSTVIGWISVFPPSAAIWKMTLMQWTQLTNCSGGSGGLKVREASLWWPVQFPWLAGLNWVGTREKAKLDPSSSTPLWYPSTRLYLLSGHRSVVALGIFCHKCECDMGVSVNLPWINKWKMVIAVNARFRLSKVYFSGRQTTCSFIYMSIPTPISTFIDYPWVCCIVL